MCSVILKPIVASAINRGMYYIELRITFASSIKYIIMHMYQIICMMHYHLCIILYIISRNLM